MSAPQQELTDAERQALQLAGRGLGPGEMANEIRALGYNHDARFWSLICVLLDTERALAFDPVLVNRLRRLLRTNRRR